jgi:[protein-PII] uridylyltransferase
VDEAVRSLAEGLPPSVAVVALGGFGRGLLTPGSDIDLMVLHRERRPSSVREAAERLFYPLWDVGFPLGHAVRTVEDCLAGARDRLDTACSLLDARLVSGDRALVEALEAGLRREVTRDPRGFVRRLAEDAERRHVGHASCTTDVEPDLKEGAGGLRDLHSIDWGGRAFASDPTGLVAVGLLREREVVALAEAEEFLIRLRSALHLETGRRSDRVHRELQPALAEAFGFHPVPGLEPADALMRALFEHGRHVAHIREAFVERATEAGDDAPAARTTWTPAEVMEAFAESAGQRRTPAPATLDAVQEALDPGPPEWTDRVRSAFLAILREGAAGVRVLEAMDRIDVLSRFLPEWEPVRCRPQRDPYHRFSVDMHLLHATAGASELLRDAQDDPLVRRAVPLVPDRDALLLGAFLHDIGKVGRGRHVPEGVRIAGQVLDRMSVPPSTRDEVLFLVGEHLLLSDTAVRRDLSDENLVLDVASRVRDPGRLASLYLLTAADAEATGPHAWSPWRQALVRELVSKVEHVLERGGAGSGGPAELKRRLSALRDLLAGEDPGRVDAYLARLPRAYVLAVAPETAAAQIDLIDPPLGSAEVRTAAVVGERPGTHDVTIVAADRPGLLAKVAGALTLAGLNILAARAFTTEDGVAVDLFTVEPAFRGHVDEERWRAMRTALRKSLEGRISLEYRVREKRRHYPRPPADVPVEVEVDNQASDFATVVEVSAPDRIGLLFDLAGAFHELMLDVHLAKVATYGPRVVDAFYVRDLTGEKVRDPEQVDEIRRAVTARLEARD